MANPVPYKDLFDIDGLNNAIVECNKQADKFSEAAVEDFKRIDNAIEATKKAITELNTSMGSPTLKLIDEIANSL